MEGQVGQHGHSESSHYQGSLNKRCQQSYGPWGEGGKMEEGSEQESTENSELGNLSGFKFKVPLLPW